jgi:hypothetical protein
METLQLTPEQLLFKEGLEKELWLDVPYEQTDFYKREQEKKPWESMLYFQEHRGFFRNFIMQQQWK